jgi:hypothetical protein
MLVLPAHVFGSITPITTDATWVQGHVQRLGFDSIVNDHLSKLFTPKRTPKNKKKRAFSAHGDARGIASDRSLRCARRLIPAAARLPRSHPPGPARNVPDTMPSEYQVCSELAGRPPHARNRCGEQY